MTRREVSRLQGFVHRHRKALLIILLATASFSATNVVAARAFNQKVEVNGARLEIDKDVYLMGEYVKISIYFVNNGSEPTTACVDRYDLAISGLLGPVEQLVHFKYLPDVICLDLVPGSERLVGYYEWKSFLPGPFTVEAFLNLLDYPNLESGPHGSVTLLVVGVR